MGQWIPWWSQFEVNIPEIDLQHRELIRRFNDLLDATWDGKGIDSIKDSLKALAEYAVDHFATEEKYMNQYDFPEYVDHKRAHDYFTADVSSLITDDEGREITLDLVLSVIIELGDWTRDHIRGMDQELGKFLAVSALPN